MNRGVLRRIVATAAAVIAVALVAASSAAAANPTVTINQGAGQADPTTGSPIEFTVQFSTTVFGFTAGDVNLSASTHPGS